MTRVLRRWPWLAAASVIVFALTASSCKSTWPRRNPAGETLPVVSGTSLEKQNVFLPTVANGEPLLLLIGYDQDAQFDLDRWLFGLDQAGWSTMTFEVPTIPGMIPQLLENVIDTGMRRGIPQEDWASVVTVYKDAAKLAAFTGNEDGLTGRIVLLNREGRVVFFHDRGYSVGTLKKLIAARQNL